jgi:hypothetical protein
MTAAYSGDSNFASSTSPAGLSGGSPTFTTSSLTAGLHPIDVFRRRNLLAKHVTGAYPNRRQIQGHFSGYIEPQSVRLWAKCNVHRDGEFLGADSHWYGNLDTVSILLGLKSIKITERHYSPWVKTRQDALDREILKVIGYFKSTAGTIREQITFAGSAMSIFIGELMEARVGIEPTYKGFADLSLTTWVPRPGMKV